MPRYLIQASYAPSAAAAFIAKPQDRVAGVKSLVEKLEGKFESLDFCLGEYDVVGIFQAPDDVTAAALALAVNAPGHLRSYRTTRLLSPQEFLQAQQKAQGTNYQAPAKG
ncbi:GYD domain-containing protein [Ramlibacter sp. AW1]|uniref:GYD domain-containing protein n=1 Tax=Ramlibacter aurantiacus TaxID=2801330 RepID=A0A936ZT37_9BURK|nr:GYD domain-containing protein [Ramlibacter aurantiacus]MBL0420645.1 GYD domain-containing protein [Ramlibacter aurantiacus]